jgi:hypothetical protein
MPQNFKALPIWAGNVGSSLEACRADDNNRVPPEDFVSGIPNTYSYGIVKLAELAPSGIDARWRKT